MDTSQCNSNEAILARLNLPPWISTLWYNVCCSMMHVVAAVAACFRNDLFLANRSGIVLLIIQWWWWCGNIMVHMWYRRSIQCLNENNEVRSSQKSKFLECTSIPLFVFCDINPNICVNGNCMKLILRRIGLDRTCVIRKVWKLQLGGKCGHCLLATTNYKSLFCSVFRISDKWQLSFAIRKIALSEGSSMVQYYHTYIIIYYIMLYKCNVSGCHSACTK